MNRHVGTGGLGARPEGHVQPYGHTSVKLLGGNKWAIEANLVDSNGSSLAATVEGVGLPRTRLPLRPAARLGAGGARRHAGERAGERRRRVNLQTPAVVGQQGREHRDVGSTSTSGGDRLAETSLLEAASF